MLVFFLQTHLNGRARSPPKSSKRKPASLPLVRGSLFSLLFNPRWEFIEYELSHYALTRKIIREDAIESAFRDWKLAPDSRGEGIVYERDSLSTPEGRGKAFRPSSTVEVQSVWVWSQAAFKLSNASNAVRVHSKRSSTVAVQGKQFGRCGKASKPISESFQSVLAFRASQYGTNALSLWFIDSK